MHAALDTSRVRCGPIAYPYPRGYAITPRLQMTQNPPDHHLLGDSSNDAVCPSPSQTRARLTSAVIVRELGLVVEQGSRA